MRTEVTLVSNDMDLYNAFIEAKLFEQVNIASSIEKTREYDSLIVSDRIYGVNELIECVSTGIRAKTIIYLLSSNKGSQSGYTALSVALQSHGVILFPSKLTENQIISRFCETVNIQDRKTKNVVVFFGASSKVGTTITAQGVAENIALNSIGQVVFLNLAGQLSFTYFKMQNLQSGLDHIKHKITNKILSAEELRGAMKTSEVCDNLSILPPCSKIVDFKYYDPECIEYLVDVAAATYDLVIVDAGWYPFTSMYIAGINCSPFRYMVTTQQPSALETYKQIKQQILDEYGITKAKSAESINDEAPQDIMLILNRFNDGISSNTHKLAEEYDMVYATSLPNVSMAFWQVEAEKRSLLGFNKYYDSQIEKLARLISIQTGYEIRETKNGKWKFWR